MLRGMMRDKVTFVRHDGAKINNIGAYVNGNIVTIFSPTLDVETDDLYAIETQTATGDTKASKVHQVRFRKKYAMIPAHYHIECEEPMI